MLLSVEQTTTFEEYKVDFFETTNIRYSAYLGYFSEWTRDKYSEEDIRVGYCKYLEWCSNNEKTSKDLDKAHRESIRTYYLIHSIEAAHLHFLKK